MKMWNKPPSNEDEAIILAILICIFSVWVIVWGLTT